MAFRIRQGLESARATVIPAQGEPLWTTDTNRLYIGDGSTPGGIQVSSEVILTEEGLQDVVGAMFNGSTFNGITFSYNDDTGKIHATVNFPPSTGGGGNFHINLTGQDSTLTRVNSANTVQFVGTAGINVGVSETPGGVTRVIIDGSAVQGGGGGGGGGGSNINYEEIGWFITGQDSTTSLINNSETVQFVGLNGINVTVDDTGGTCQVNISAPDVGTITATDTIHSLSYYASETGNDLISSGPDMQFYPNQGIFEANVLSAPSMITTTLTVPVSISNIQANTPIAGQATMTLVGQPHPPYKTGRWVKLQGVDNSGWNDVYSIVSCTSTELVVTTTNSFTYNSGGVLQETNNPLYGFAIFPTGSDRFITMGGVTDLGNTLGPQEYSASLRVLDQSAHNPFSPAILEIIQINDSAEPKQIAFSRGRGTFSATTGVQLGDKLGSISFTGLDGVNSPLINGLYPPPSVFLYAEVAEPVPAISGSPGIAGKFVIQTANSDSGYLLSDALIIDSHQHVYIPSNLEVHGTIRLAGNRIETISSNANLDLRAHGSGSINLEADTYITGTLLVSNINTNDSSAISFSPAVIFNSDVTVENDLVVNNKVYAKEFVSTSIGTPEIVTTSNFKINSNGNEWIYNTTGDLTLPDNSTIGNSLWTAATSGYVGLNANNGDNSVSVGDNTVIVTTNANTLSYNFYFNPDGGLQLPVRSSAPPSPISGSVYVADGTAWDPDSKSGAYPYPVYYDGNTYNALY